MDRIGYALVGTGYFGAELGRIMNEQENARVVAVFDPNNAVEIAKEFPREYRVVPGLKATAYLTSPGLEDIKAQMDLLNYQDTLIQAFFAKDDNEVKSIIESFRNQLQAAGNEQFKAKLEEIYKEDNQAIQFY